MQVTSYLKLFETKRLTEGQLNDLHQELYNDRQLAYTIDVTETDEFWVLKGEENDCHLWEVTYHHRLIGENYEFSHALISSRAIEYSMHDILDQLNVALKAKHSN